MLPRPTSALLAVTLAFGVVGCSSIPAGHVAPPSSAFEPVTLPSPVSPERTAMTASSTPANATATPDSGNVDAPVAPGLSVEPLGPSSIRVTLADPAAKAWRVTVTGVGARAADRWSLTVETGDVAPVITTVETANGVDGEPQEQPTLEMPDASGRICAASLRVCLAAARLALPHDGTGTLVLELTRTDGSALGVTGSTATWPADPFVLGPWTTTEAFPWAA